MRFQTLPAYADENLGHFRLSVSDDPHAFDLERKRLAVAKLTDPWAKLAAAYSFAGHDTDLTRLLTKRPKAEIGLAELAVAAKDWEVAIAACSRLIALETSSADLLAKRAAAYVAIEQWEPARADWLRATSGNHQAAGSAFAAFRHANRVGEAAEFGLLHLENKPDDLELWSKLAPILLLAGNEQAYRKWCTRIVNRFSATSDPLPASEVCRICLLLPNVIDPGQLPQEALVVSDDKALFPKRRAEIWSARALVAYRSGDARAALDYAQNSDEHSPSPMRRIDNATVQAMAHHDLAESEKAVSRLEWARNMLELVYGRKLETGNHPTGNHPTGNHPTGNHPFEAEVLIREAEAKIIGKMESKTSSVESDSASSAGKMPSADKPDGADATPENHD